LADVLTRLHGAVVTVSTCGVKVHFETRPKEQPRAGEIYRVQSRDDLILCEVRCVEVAGAGADIGLQIVQRELEST